MEGVVGGGEEEEEYKEAVEYVGKKLQGVSDQVKLRFYGLYKQVTEGDCKVSKPYFWDMVGSAKWEAWNSVKGQSKAASRKAYIDELTKLVPNWRSSTPSSDTDNTNTSGKSTGTGGPVFSRPEVSQTDHIAEDKKDITYYVAQGDLQKVVGLLKNNKALINYKDEEGRAPLHYACDRANVAMVEELLRQGADLNIQDAEGQTGLHYAATVGSADILMILLRNGADTQILDNEGESASDSDEIRNMIKQHSH